MLCGLFLFGSGDVIENLVAVCDCLCEKNAVIIIDKCNGVFVKLNARNSDVPDVILNISYCVYATCVGGNNRVTEFNNNFAAVICSVKIYLETTL